MATDGHNHTAAVAALQPETIPIINPYRLQCVIDRHLNAMVVYTGIVDRRPGDYSLPRRLAHIA